MYKPSSLSQNQCALEQEKDQQESCWEIVACLALLVAACFPSTCSSFPEHHTLLYDIPYVISSGIKVIIAFKAMAAQK